MLSRYPCGFNLNGFMNDIFFTNEEKLQTLNRWKVREELSEVNTALSAPSPARGSPSAPPCPRRAACAPLMHLGPGARNTEPSRRRSPGHTPSSRAALPLPRFPGSRPMPLDSLRYDMRVFISSPAAKPKVLLERFPHVSPLRHLQPCACTSHAAGVRDGIDSH